jgi:hypothetical protein
MAEKAKVSETSMGRALAAICVGGNAGARPTVDGQQRRGAWLLPLHEARSAFAKAMKHELEWPDVDGGWVRSLPLGPEAALAASRQSGTAEFGAACSWADHQPLHRQRRLRRPLPNCTTRNSIMLQRGYIVEKSYQVRQLPPFSRNYQAK